MSGSQMPERVSSRWRARPEKWWWISTVILIPVALLTGISTLVLAKLTHPHDASTQIDLVRTALSVGAGTGGFVALVLAGRRQWSTEVTNRIAEHDAAERRITELYTKAADQLGSDNAIVRLAGLHALERLGSNAPTQQEAIGSVICGYLRMNSYRSNGLSDNIGEERIPYSQGEQELEVRKAAIDILARHYDMNNTDDHWPRLRIRLQGAYIGPVILGNVYLGDAYLTVAYLAGAYLRGANLQCANLGGAFLIDAHMSRANLVDAYAADAKLTDVDLTNANLAGADLAGADLSHADLSKANLMRTKLTNANLCGAVLSGATLIGANLTGADLSKADLAGADLSGANVAGANLTGVVRDQKTVIRHTRTDSETRGVWW